MKHDRVQASNEGDPSQYSTGAAVIIPVRNHTDLLGRSLRSLARQRADIEFGVVIVDDGSEEDVRGVAARYRDRLKLTVLRREGSRPSPAAARDLGVRSVDAEILLFVDSGVVLTPSYVAAHHAVHRDADRIGVGYCHGHQLHVEQGNEWAELLAESDDPIEAWRTQPRLRDLRHVLAPLVELNQPWVYGWGGNLSCRRDTYVRVGGFSLDHNYGFEDLDLAWRLYRAGAVPTVVEEGWGVHLPHPRRPLAERQALDAAGWSLSYRRDRAVELEIARLGIDVVGTGPDALANLDRAMSQITALLTWRASRGPVQPMPEDLPRPLHAVAGHVSDLEWCDTVSLGILRYRSTATEWGCCGVLLPVPDKTIGTVLARASWLQHMAGSFLGSRLLERFSAEIQRAADVLVIVVGDILAAGVAQEFADNCDSVKRFIFR